MFPGIKWVLLRSYLACGLVVTNDVAAVREVIWMGNKSQINVITWAYEPVGADVIAALDAV